MKAGTKYNSDVLCVGCPFKLSHDVGVLLTTAVRLEERSSYPFCSAVQCTAGGQSGSKGFCFLCLCSCRYTLQHLSQDHFQPQFPLMCVALSHTHKQSEQGTTHNPQTHTHPHPGLIQVHQTSAKQSLNVGENGACIYIYIYVIRIL